LGIGAEGDCVQGGGAVPGAYLARIHGVIAEILVSHIPVLVADLAIVMSILLQLDILML